MLLTVVVANVPILMRPYASLYTILLTVTCQDWPYDCSCDLNVLPTIAAVAARIQIKALSVPLLPHDKVGRCCRLTEIEEETYLCPSEVGYVRPLRAVNTDGKWRVIVNNIKVPCCNLTMEPGATGIPDLSYYPQGS